MSTPSVEQRQDTLNREVARYVGQGYATESVSGAQAVLVKRVKIGWFWNIILSILTGGLWLIVVLFRVLNRKDRRIVLFVNEFGAVERR